MAQRIVIPGFRKIETSGGGEGTGNYNDLTNKPSINNVPLVGNLKTVDLKLTDTTLTEEGVPAEAKTVGELIADLNSNKGNFTIEHGMNNRIKDCLNVNIEGTINFGDYDYNIAAEQDTNGNVDLVDSPVDGTFYAYRKILKIPNINSDGSLRAGCKVIVKLTEAYPIPGRIWLNVYEPDGNKGWTGWTYITPNALS